MPSPSPPGWPSSRSRRGSGSPEPQRSRCYWACCCGDGAYARLLAAPTSLAAARDLVLVAVNNFLKLPAGMGMDYDGHVAYVQFILERGALPLATDGWEMFQSPLYYLLCAGMASLLGAWNGLVIRMFGLISIASALGQIEIAYRLSRRVFPEREDLQKVAILVSGLLPMGFAVSQGIGNEPLHAVLGALTLLLAVRLVQRDGPTRRRRDSARRGLGARAAREGDRRPARGASLVRAVDPNSPPARGVAARTGRRRPRRALQLPRRRLVLLRAIGSCSVRRSLARRSRADRSRREVLVAGAGLSDGGSS